MSFIVLRGQLIEFFRVVTGFVNAHSRDVPTRSYDRWAVIRENNERRLQEAPVIEKDYHLFLEKSRATVQALTSFKTLLETVRGSSEFAHAFRLDINAPPLADEMLDRYLLRVASTILLHTEGGEDLDTTLAKQVGLLIEFIQQETCPVTFAAPLANFRSDSTDVKLVDDMFLRPISDATLEFYINGLGHSRPFSDLYRFLTLEFQIEEVVRQPRSTAFLMPVGVDVVDRFQNLLKSLRLTRPGAVELEFLVGDARGQLGMGGSWFSYAPIPRPAGDSFEITEDELAKVREIFVNLNRVEGHKQFALAMRRFMHSYDEGDLGDRLIDYWIALESLLMPGSDAGELKYRVALRTVYFLAETDDKTRAFEKIQESYNARSKVVHGRHLDKVDQELVAFTQNCLRNVLVKCVSEGKVPTGKQLDLLVLGSTPL